MVAIKRQSMPTPKGRSSSFIPAFLRSALGMPTNYAASTFSSSSSPSVCPESGILLRSPRHHAPLNRSNGKSFQRIMILAAYTIAIFSAAFAFKRKRSLSVFIESLQLDAENLMLEHEGANRSLLDAKEAKELMYTKIKQLKRAQRLLEHELRIQEEDDSSAANVEIDMHRKKSIVMNWVQQRQGLLHDRLQTLRTFIQTVNRKQIIQKYGEGPHRVRFDIKRVEAAESEFFELEMASMHEVPHSSWIFLEMIDNGLWNNTVFYHHSSTGHVIAAAPVEHGTFEGKHNHFEALGYTGMSFAEYSSTMPHEELTVGFSGRGPNFYINTMDNSKHHGPGGQAHHDLPDEADACFAKIVKGSDVVHKMRRPTSVNGKTNQVPVSWHDYDVTHIIGAAVL